MFLLRPATENDLEPLFELAKFLDSPNLPADRALLGARIERSTHSFGSAGAPSAERA